MPWTYVRIVKPHIEPVRPEHPADIFHLRFVVTIVSNKYVMNHPAHNRRFRR